MADSVTIQVDGLRQLGEALRELGDVTARKICGQATGAAARLVKEAAKNNIRRSPSVDTGSLLESVIVKKLSKSQTDLTSAHIVTPRHHRQRRKTKQRQSVAPHAVFVEFGTVNMAAEPFLGPALSQNISQATNAMKDKLSTGIAIAARRARKT